MCRFLTIFIACLFVLQLNAKSRSKEPEVDFSIIERTAELSGYLSSSQRIELVRIEDAVKSAQEKVRSGQFMQTRKPSSLNPDEDVKAIHARGKKLVEEGEQELTSAKIRLVTLLEQADKQRSAQRQALADRYQFSMATMDYASALKKAAEKVLADAWQSGYNHILFDGVRTVSNGKSEASDVDTRNQTYDILIAIDGTRFTLSMPMNLSYSESENEAARFAYDNEDAFSDAKAALLAIEKILPSGTQDALLAVRAIDLHTFKLISGQSLALKRVGPEAEATDSEAAAIHTIAGKITDQNDLLTQLAALDSPYLFGWDLSSPSDPDTALVYSLLLQQTIHQNSGLQILEAAFVERTYLNASESGGIAQQPSAVFQLAPAASSDGQGDNYTLSARLTSNNREVVIGMASFNNEASN